MSPTPFLAADGPADLVLRGGHVFVARGRPPASALAVHGGRVVAAGADELVAGLVGPTFKALGVIASVQPSHCIDDMRWAEKRIGHERCHGAYRFRSFLAAGIPVAFGTDWFVEPLDPRLGLYAAVTRELPEGGPPGGFFGEERLDLEEAIDLYTRGSAYAEFADADKGTLEPGQLADLVVFAADLFALPPRRILTTPVDLTVVGGRVVFERQR